MILHEAAPRGWDQRIAFALQSAGFAEATRALGYRPLFVDDARGVALALIRRVPVPLLGRWTVRAKVYAHRRDAAVVAPLVERLGRLGVSHVRLGDSLFGWSGDWPAGWSTMRPLVYHVFTHDLTVTEDELLARTRRMIRRHLRKSADEVTVSEVRTEADLAEYVALATETRLRMRVRNVAAVYPRAYFDAIFREMVPRRQAVLFIARAGGVPLAAATFAMTAEHCAQIHGCSTRDRALTPKQGPTLLFWHAMRYARAQGCRTFDMGAVTPTHDPAHPHHSVYEYKKQWGGELRAVHGAELIVSAWKHRFQELVLAPMWARVHPVYLRMFQEPALAGPGAGLLELSVQEPRA